jgi:hypothetical protein
LIQSFRFAYPEFEETYLTSDLFSFTRVIFDLFQAVIGVEGCGVSHLLATLQRPAPRWCGLSSRAPRMQIVVNFLTINVNLTQVSVPPSCVNSQFGPRFSAELNDAEGFLVCYHANVSRSLHAATRLIKELIAYKRTGLCPFFSLSRFNFLFEY